MKLYLVSDESVPLNELVTIVEEAIKGGVTAVQLREKKNTGLLFYEKAVRLKALTEKYRVPLFINDRVDIALAANADGVHIGQEDLPLSQVKKMVPPSMLVGVSCGSVEEAIAAEQSGADYIGVGAVFPTQSKDNAKLLPEGELERIIQSVTIPIVAIGGIKLRNLPAIRHLDIAGVAVVSEIMKANDPFKAAWLLREAFESKK